jgi:uncharacterized protein HemX
VNDAFISYAALGLAFVGFIVQQIRATKTASSDRVKDLEDNIKECGDQIRQLKVDLTASRAEVERLEGENLRLMRKLLANGSRP